MPRYYTIASSCIVAPKDIKIAISLSSFDTPKQEKRLGLVSALCELMQTVQNMSVRIFAKDSNFDMNNNAPLLMVGPGTGIVPFIAFSDERKHLKDSGSPIAEGHLYFGCRDVDNDFIYRNYLASMVDCGVLAKLNHAFSRSKDGSPKQYVQDLLRKDKSTIERLLRDEQGSLYLCGATKMGQDVQSLVKEVLGEVYYKQMEQEKRIIVELWSS